MKKTLSIVSLFLLSFTKVSAQDCDLPLAYEGNTGSNMTVMLTSSFISSLNVTDPDAFLVALSADGSVVGSEVVAGISQTTLAVWGDDSQTTEVVDGALANEALSFQLVNGTDLYDVVMPSAVSFVGNALVAQTAAAQLTLVECESSTILGCTDATAENYNMNATEDDGTCEFEEPVGEGCDLPSPFEGNTGSNMTVMLTSPFISSLNVSASDAYLVALSADGSVVGSEVVAGISQTALSVWGDDSSTDETDGALAGEAISFQLVDGDVLFDVTAPNPVSYNTNSMVPQLAAAVLTEVLCGDDDGDVSGCTNPSAFNYDANATTDDGSCTAVANGCMDATAFNYDANANTDDGSCIAVANGCTNPLAFNFDADANSDDGSCTAVAFGCTDESAFNYDPAANTDDDSCISAVLGCTNPLAFNFDAAANSDDGSCTAVALGCTDESAFNFDSSANTDDNSCIAVVLGCINPLAFNFDATANVDDNSCQAIIGGCMNPLAANYNEDVNTQIEGACIEVVYGCTYDYAFVTNFNALATVNLTSADDSTDPCIYDFGTRMATSVCIDPLAENYLPVADESSDVFNSVVASNVTIDNTVCEFIEGCTDGLAINYNYLAVVDDNSCEAVALGCTDATAFNFDASANTDDGSCEVFVYGCTDALAFNHDASANTDDGSCQDVALGCTDATAFNFDAFANTDNASCEAVVNGCTDALAFNHDASANTDDGSCEAVALGCTDATAFNHDASANTDDGSCEVFVYGCTDALAFNFDASANTDDASCEAVVNGCTNVNATNYNASANTDNNSCEFDEVVQGCTDPLYLEFDVSATEDNGSCATLIIEGCTDSLYTEYNALANTDDGSCAALVVEGCTDSLYTEYNALANTDDGSCATLIVEGCTDSFYTEYNALANTDDSSCATPVVEGCTDSLYTEYNALANTDDSSCATPVVEGCTDSLYTEYNALANTDDSSCATLVVEGCTDSLYTEYNALANTDDSSCATLIVEGCTDSLYTEYNALANTDDSSCATLIVEGCTDALAFNFDADANTDDASCAYNVPISFQLSSGWNMVGYTGTADNSGIVAQMDDALGNDAGTAATFQVIKNVSGQFWSAAYAQISDFTQGEGYMMFVNGTPTSVNFQKESGYISGIDYPLSAGWNMVAFTGDVNSEKDIVTAMDAALENGAGTANTFQVIKNVSGQFWSAAYAQISSFTPGEAYMMFVNGAPTSVNFQRE